MATNGVECLFHAFKPNCEVFAKYSLLTLSLVCTTICVLGTRCVNVIVLSFGLCPIQHVFKINATTHLCNAIAVVGVVDVVVVVVVVVIVVVVTVVVLVEERI